MLKFKNLFLVLAAISSAASAIGAEIVSTTGRDAIYANGYVHKEQRDGVSRSNPEFFVGYDRYIPGLGPIYAGPRLGVYVERLLTFSTGTNSTKPFLGGHAYYLAPLSSEISGKLGVAVDVLKGDDNDPLYLYLGGETGLRVNVTPELYAEIPVEVGFFPFFDGVPVFLKVGLQLGYRL